MRRFTEAFRRLRNPVARRASVVILAAAAVAVAGTASTQIIRSTEKPIDPSMVYMQPIKGLSHSQLQKFQAGEKQFKNPWVVFPLLGGDWGLGPTFLAASCIGCHVQAGRGRTFDNPNVIAFQQLLRLSIPGEGSDGGPNPHPNYGDQLQVFGVNVGLKENLKPGEAELYIDWIAETVTLSDGEKVELRKPKIRIEKPNFGAIDESVMTSLRNTQVVFGMGYLEAVTEEDILALAKLQQSQGLNGRPNYVRDDINKRVALGRFGWKANQPNVRQQIVAAFHGDMGVTSSLYIEENCPPIQKECRAMPPVLSPICCYTIWVLDWQMVVRILKPVRVIGALLRSGALVYLNKLTVVLIFCTMDVRAMCLRRYSGTAVRLKHRAIYLQA